VILMLSGGGEGEGEREGRGRRKGRKRREGREEKAKVEKKDAYLTHGCGFADGKVSRFRSAKGFSSLVPEISLLPRRISSALLPSMEEESLRCARSGVSFRSERRTAATEREPGKADDLRAKVVGWLRCFPLCVLGVASHWLR
jgi:hypothetical protein